MKTLYLTNAAPVVSAHEVVGFVVSWVVDRLGPACLQLLVAPAVLQVMFSCHVLGLVMLSVQQARFI